MRGTWREGSCRGDPEGYDTAVEMGASSHRCPVLGNMGDVPFLGPSREG